MPGVFKEASMAGAEGTGGKAAEDKERQSVGTKSCKVIGVYSEWLHSSWNTQFLSSLKMRF